MAWRRAAVVLACAACTSAAAQAAGTLTVCIESAPEGMDVVQFDEPAFNVYMQDAADWGVQALEIAAHGLACTTAVHICYGYGIKANTDWKNTLGDQWRQYEQVFPALAKSSIQQVSLECYHSHVPWLCNTCPKTACSRAPTVAWLP